MRQPAGLCPGGLALEFAMLGWNVIGVVVLAGPLSAIRCSRPKAGSP